MIRVCGRWWWHLGLILVIGIASLPGCLPGTNGGGPAMEIITWSGEGTPDYLAYQAATERFKKEHPEVTVKYTGLATAALYQMLLLRLKTSSDVPEIAQFTGEPFSVIYLSEFVRAGWLYDLTEAMRQPAYGQSDRTWQETLNPAVLPHLTDRGRIVAFPGAINAVVILYNKKIFQRYGLEEPTTWAEFLKVCRILKEKGVTPLAGTGNIIYTGLWYSYLVQRTVGTSAALAAWRDEGRSFTEQPFVEAAKKFRTLLEDGYFQENYLGYSEVSALSSFYKGEMAMMLYGTWGIPATGDQQPENFELGVMPFPVIEGGAGRRDEYFGGVTMLFVTATSKHPEWGVEWARIYNSVEVQDLLVEYTNLIPPVRGTKAPQWGVRAQLVEALVNAKAIIPYDFGLGTTDPALRSAFYEAIPDLEDVRKMPEEFVAKLDKKVKAYWEEQGSR